jgi:hypothetical protein
MQGRRLTTEEFISKARAIFGDSLDYSKVNYINKDRRVELVCPIHGAFWDTPDRILYGKTRFALRSVRPRGLGCPLCENVKMGTTEEFIASARKLHGNRYDYSQVEYVNIRTPVKIICPIHGYFWQRPHNHLKGRHGKGARCPGCSRGWRYLETMRHRYEQKSNETPKWPIERRMGSWAPGGA